MQHMVRFEHVSKYFDEERAIYDVSFSIEQGQKFVLLGTSGSGKSTVLKHINALLTPTSGDIWINNISLNALDKIALRRNTGYIIQDVGLFPHYTIAQNIALIPSLQTKSKDDGIEIDKLMTSLKLDHSLKHKYPDELSGGQRQRVGIARALAGDPDMLLLDEPLSALDPITKEHIQDDFMHLESLKSKTMVWVTHDIKEAFKVGDTICLMDHGIIQQIGTARTFILSPKTEFVKSFFGSDRLNYLINTLTIDDLKSTNHLDNANPKKVQQIEGNMKLTEFLERSNFPMNIEIKNADGTGQTLPTELLFKNLLSYY